MSKALVSNGDDRYETARKLTEAAMDALIEGDERKARKLLREARAADSAAVDEIIQDLEEDAGSDHTVPNHT